MKENKILITTSSPKHNHHKTFSITCHYNYNHDGVTFVNHVNMLIITNLMMITITSLPLSQGHSDLSNGGFTFGR
jgi:hypothetical protein